MQTERKKVTDKEYRDALLGILERIHRVCEEQGVRYMAMGGTLLGAVRHQGFIPWDDDIDIMMPREDYPKFAKAFASEDGRFYTLDPNNSEYYYNNFARACDGKMILKLHGVCDIEHLGVFVDVFFLDRWPQEEAEVAQYRKDLLTAYKNVQYALPAKIMNTLDKKRRIKRKLQVPRIVLNRYLIGLKKRKQQKENLLTKYKDTNTGVRATVPDKLRNKRWYIAEDALDDRILMPFEHLQIYVPASYDYILTFLFKAYMQLPPEDQRKSHHHFVAYWSEV